MIMLTDGGGSATYEPKPIRKLAALTWRISWEAGLAGRRNTLPTSECLHPVARRLAFWGVAEVGRQRASRARSVGLYMTTSWSWYFWLEQHWLKYFNDEFNSRSPLTSLCFLWRSLLSID